MAQDFRAQWSVQRQDWEEVLALFKTLGDLAEMRELTRFIDAVGRAERSGDGDVFFECDPAPDDAT